MDGLVFWVEVRLVGLLIYLFVDPVVDKLSEWLVR